MAEHQKNLGKSHSGRTGGKPRQENRESDSQPPAAKPVSLAPLEFEEAMRSLLQVKRKGGDDG